MPFPRADCWSGGAAPRRCVPPTVTSPRCCTAASRTWARCASSTPSTPGGRYSSGGRDNSARLPPAATRSTDTLAENPCALAPVFHHATFAARSPARGAMLKYAHRLMKLLSRVVWSEGMHLGPHHFQVQSRYFEDSIQFATSSLWFASYGLAGLELDADALYNGSVSLLHARGILPDGLPFNMPESDDLPQ